MIRALSPNTQAILLLTAPLIAGRAPVSQDLLSPSELVSLARKLNKIQHKLSDLLSPDGAELMRACQSGIDAARLQRLMGRGFLLSQVIERWQARSIWVVSLADSEYPRRLKEHLPNTAPPVLYCCGDISLLASGGLAVVGTRNVDDILIAYASAVGQLTAEAGFNLVSGGAKGIDKAVMHGALEAGGTVTAVLADGLERSTMNRDHRNLILDGRLLLISPYDPSVGINAVNTVQRNKVIYALADASLIVNSDLNKGGTWAGAVEQLDSEKLAPVYVRSTGRPTPGLDALLSKGAVPWPNPKDANELKAVLMTSGPTQVMSHQLGLTLFSGEGQSGKASISTLSPEITPQLEEPVEPKLEPAPTTVDSPESVAVPTTTAAVAPSTPADALFAVARELMVSMLKVPMKDIEIAMALNISNAQARAWLQRLIEEGSIEKQRNRAIYVSRNDMLFGQLWQPIAQFPDCEDNK